MKRLFTIMLVLILASAATTLADDFFGPTMLPTIGEVKFMKADANDKVYAGTWGGGLYTSEDEGATWTRVVMLDAEFLSDLHIDASGLYLTSFDNGVYFSTDGASWSNISNDLPTLNTKAITALANGDIFVGTYGKGVYLSQDGGTTWESRSEGLLFRDVNAIDYTLQGFILAGTNGGGVYRSIDSGKTWIRSNTGFLSDYVNDIFVDRSNGEIYGASSGSGVRFSANGGVSWGLYKKDGIHPFANCITLNTNAGKKEIIAGTKRSGIFYYDDEVWDDWRRSNLTAGGITSIVTLKSGIILASEASNKIVFSENEGRFWKPAGTLPQSGRLNLFPFGDASILVQKENGDIFFSHDHGNTWDQKNNISSRVVSFALDSSGNYWMGRNDGLYTSTDGGDNWNFMRFADTTSNAIAITPNNNIFVAWNHTVVNGEGQITVNDNGVVRTTNRGNSWTNTDAVIHNPVENMYSRGNDRIVLNTFSNDSIIFSERNGIGAWTLVDGYNGTLRGFDVWDIRNVYAATEENVFISGNNGLSWNEYNIGINNETTTNATKIIVIANEQMYVQATFWEGIFPFQGVYRSYLDNDGFLAWDTVSNSLNYFNYDNFERSSNGDLYVYNRTMLYKALNREKMPPPVLLAPLGSVLTDLSPEFSWSTAPVADMYELQISESETFATIKESVVLADTVYSMFRELDFNTDIYWRVRSKTHNAVGEWAVGTAKTMLNPPLLISPENDTLGVPVFATLIWENVENAEGFVVQVSENDSFDELTFDDTNVAALTIMTSQLKGLTKYFWRVKAFNEDGESLWSETWAFTTVLGPPQLISPEDGAVELLSDVTFTWEEVPEASRHELQVADNTEFNNPVFNGETSGNTSHNLQGLEYNTTYYWRMNSSNDDGTSVWGDYWQFKTAYSPVVLLSPADGSPAADIDVDLDWEDHPNGAIYRLQISENSDFEGEFVYDDLVEGESIFDTGVITLENNTQYYWRVRLEMEDQNGLWSETWNFLTRLSQPILRSPANNSTELPTTIQTIWFAVNNVDTYLLQIARDMQFNDLIFSQDDIAQTQFTFEDLEANTQYYWRVRATNENGLSLWSEVWTFTTGAAAPVLVFPENFADNVGTNFEFEWKDLGGALSYNLVVATDSEFNNIFTDDDNINAIRYTVSGLVEETTYFWRIRANLVGGEQSGWSETRTFNTGDGSSVADYLNTRSYRLYPMPAINQLTCEFEALQSTAAEFTIHNVAGALVSDIGKVMLNEGTNRIVTNVNSLSSGVYFIKIESSTFTEMILFVVE